MQVFPRRYVDQHRVPGQQHPAGHALPLPKELRGLPCQETRLPDGGGAWVPVQLRMFTANGNKHSINNQYCFFCFTKMYSMHFYIHNSYFSLCLLFFQKLKCQRKEPCRLFSVKKTPSRPEVEEVTMSSLCSCPHNHRCPRHHLDVGVVPGRVYTEDAVRTYSGYCM